MEKKEYLNRRFSRFEHWFSTLKYETRTSLKALAVSNLKSKSPVKKLINSNDINDEMYLLYEEVVRSKCWSVEEFIAGKIKGKA